MNVLILEDEMLSAQRAKNLLHEHDPTIAVLETIDSVEDATDWLSRNPEPDLMLVDIHLSDGLSFDLFKKIQVKSPVIFTTAYDQYAIQAFKTNSIDYLLKPLDKSELGVALGKYHALSQERKSLLTSDIQRIMQTFQASTKKYKNRFLVKFGDNIQFKNTDEIAYFFADDKITYLVSNEGRRFVIDHKLEQLESLLDPQFFFRLNRKFIIRIDAVQKIKTLVNSRLQIFLKPNFEQDIFVSKEKTSEFKTWLDQ
ncbi:MAG: LytTR family DNA-binding domain-containing protein [Arcicella sp.]|jgi:two-component system, LytTR family, response regulator LytT|nr:LytTR family DNA-binding domain-containing protein [Arcicella sp.]